MKRVIVTKLRYIRYTFEYVEIRCFIRSLSWDKILSPTTCLQVILAVVNYED